MTDFRPGLQYTAYLYKITPGRLKETVNTAGRQTRGLIFVVAEKFEGCI
jgi:hypothetical protein